MNLQVFSDIYLEMYKDKSFYTILTKSNNFNNALLPICDILILAGDIGKITDGKYIEFLRYCSSNWKYVIYVLGNHEFYCNNSIAMLLIEYKKLFDSFGNIFLLNDSYIELDGITFYGFIGWTKPKFNSENVDHYINDYNYMKSTTVNDMVIESKEKFNDFMLNTESTNIIVITHFPPISKNTSDPIYSNSGLSWYFCWNNYLDENEIPNKDKIKYWISGHTHWSYDFIENDIRYISNQIGYFDENVNFNNGVIN